MIIKEKQKNKKGIGLTRIKEILILSLVLMAVGFSVRADEMDDYVERLWERFDQDLGVLERIDEALFNEDAETFLFILVSEYQSFQTSHNLYKNRPEGLEEEMVEVGKKLEFASGKIVEGTDLFISLPESDDYTEKDFEQAGQSIDLGREVYAQVLEEMSVLFQEYQSTRKIYLYGAIGGLIGLASSFLALRKRDKALRAAGEKMPFLGFIPTGFFYITLGFGLTLISYEWLPGGTYFIFWGLPIYGGYLILKGLSLLKKSGKSGLRES